MNQIVKVENVSKVYEEGNRSFYALKGVSMEVKKGEFLAIMGRSGSGKSTLLNMLSGLDQPSKGSVFLNGRSLYSLGDKQLTNIRRREVGFIFQFFNLLPVLTVFENVVLPLELAGQKRTRKSGEELLKRLGIDHLKDQYPSQLSGGQQQRVAIARSLITKPSIILADEPTGSLDSKTGKETLAILREFCDHLGHSLVMVTHDATVASYAHRVLFLQDGRVKDELALLNEGYSRKEYIAQITERVEGMMV